MRQLENYIRLDNLESAKKYLVPYIFTENYYNILKAKLQGKKLTENKRYYYNHFIKQKLIGMMSLFDIDTDVNGIEFIIGSRLDKANALLQKYSRKHKNMKMLVSGSFLYQEKYTDIDLFIISKYDKEDYREGKVHVNFLPADIEKKLFFQSIKLVSILNFKPENVIEEKIDVSDMLYLYELVILLIIQKDEYLQELRDLIVRLEYISNRVILNSMQLKIFTDKVTKSRNPTTMISKYFIAKIICSYKGQVLKKELNRFIEKNSYVEKGHKVYENWKIYNNTYREALEIVT